MCDFNVLLHTIDAWIWGWPLVIIVISTGLLLTIALWGVQFRYFFTSWKYVFSPAKSSKSAHYITPLQAFINILSSSIGNGSMAGMATAVVGGGPGAGFWIFVLGFLYLAIRYAEVFLSLSFQERVAGVMRGGPMAYLKHVPGRTFLPSVYAFFCLALSLITGDGMQCNSIRLGLERVAGIPPLFIACGLGVFMLYIMLGGAQRIIKFSETIVPLKVILFFSATLVVLVYHRAALLDALTLIITSALQLKAFAGGLLGFSVQQSLRYGMSRSLNATEVGLGVSGILYGSTKEEEPIKSSIMSMATAFITSHLVCFLLVVVLVVSGVWNSGLQSTHLTMAAYETVFGAWGGILVALLSIIFGLGVLVTYAYIGKECWFYLMRGRAGLLYTILYCAMAFWGALAHVEIIWNATSIINAGLVIITMYAILWLLPKIRRDFYQWEKRKI